MAFPFVESAASTGRTAAETTSPISYPASVSPNVLLVAIVRATAVGAIGWPAGWAEIVETSFDSSDDVTALAWKIADGTEGGTTFNVTHGNSKMAAIVYSITGARLVAPQISTAVTDTTATPDPGPLTPAGGALDWLWLWLGGWEGEQTSPPASNPLNYTNPLGANTGIIGTIPTNCRVASARRNLNAATEDPGSWTISAVDDWTAWTMAIEPAAVGTTFFQTIAATVVGTAILATVSLYVRALRATALGVVELTRIVTYVRSLIATATGLAILSRLGTYGRNLSAVAVGTVMLVKNVPRTLAVTAVGVPILVAQQVRGVILAVTAIGVSALGKVPTYSRTLAAVGVGISGLPRIVTYSKTLAATAVGTTTLIASVLIAQVLAVASTGLAGLTRIQVSIESRIARLEARLSALKKRLGLAHDPDD